MDVPKVFQEEGFIIALRLELDQLERYKDLEQLNEQQHLLQTYVQMNEYLFLFLPTIGFGIIFVAMFLLIPRYFKNK